MLLGVILLGEIQSNNKPGGLLPLHKHEVQVNAELFR